MKLYKYKERGGGGGGGGSLLPQKKGTFRKGGWNKIKK